MEYEQSLAILEADGSTSIVMVIGTNVKVEKTILQHYPLPIK